MNSRPKYLLLITGIPASGKTYLSHQLEGKFHQLPIKILSTDTVQGFLTHHPNFDLQAFHKLFSSLQWDFQLKQFKLHKKKFNENIWNFSRKIVQNFDILDQIFSNCQVLIIQDELPLRSQRKPFKKYCSERKTRFLEISMQITKEQAMKNNIKRGLQNEIEQVSNQVIAKSFEKFQFSADALVLTQQAMPQFLNSPHILQKFKIVQIEDNYSQHLAKKNIIREYSSNEMDQNQLRKLISKIMKDETVAEEYFLGGLQNKKKAQILAECKKSYIQQKREISFTKILESFMLKNEAN